MSTPDVSPSRRKNQVEPVTTPHETGKMDADPTSSRTDSTLSKSKKKAEKKDAVEAGVPFLPLPWITLSQFDNSFNVNTQLVVSAATGIQPLDVQRLYNDATKKIIDGILDSMAKDVENLKKAIERDIKERAPQEEHRRRQEEMLLIGMQAIVRDQQSRVHRQDLVLFNSLPPLMTSFFVGVAMVGGMMVAEVASSVVRSAEIAASSLSGMVSMVARSVPIDDFRAELGLIGGLLALMNQVTVEGSHVPRVVQKPIDLEYAKNYAKNVLQTVNGNEIDAFILGTLVTKLERISPIQEERRKELVHIVKIVLLAMALGMLYQVRTGWITGKEFDAMVSGEMEYEDNEIGKLMKQLASLIGLHAQFLAPTERGRLLRALSDYFETRPALENLRDPDLVFGELFNFLKPNGHQGPV